MRSIHLILWLLLLSLAANSQQPFVRDYWLNESNTPVNVNTIVQDKNGFIWLGTVDGLYKFNGRNFVIQPGQGHDPVTALANVKGTIWVGYKSGKLSKLINGINTAKVFKEYKINTTIRDIAALRDDLLLATDAGIVYVVKDSARLFTSKDGLADNFVYSFSAFGKNSLAASSDNGINTISLEKNRLHFGPFLNGLFLPDNIIRVVKTNHDGSEGWIGMQQAGVLWFEEKNGKVNSVIAKDWKWGQVNDILLKTDNNALVATEDGYLIELHLNNNNIDAKVLYHANRIFNKLLLDNTGNVWCVTNYGISMVTLQYASYLALKKPYSLPDINAMICDRLGGLLYAQKNALYRISLNEDEPKIIHVAALPASITCFYLDPSNVLWIGTFGKGLWHYKDGELKQVKDINTLLDGNILSLIGNRDELWVASLNGVEQAKITDPVFGKLQLIKHHTKQYGMGSDYIYQLFTDRPGNIWMATDGGSVCMYDGASYHHWDSSTGMRSKVFYSIAESSDSSIWSASLDNGIYFYDGKFWHQVGKRDGLQDINISTLAANNTGQIIIVSQKGIDEWYPGSHHFRHFNRRMLSDIDSVSSVLNCAAKDTNGNVYIPFEKGFLVFNNQQETYDTRPGVSITGVNVFQRSVPYIQHDFPSDSNYISFNFDGVSLIGSEPLHYRYKLDGYNTSWISTDDESVSFPQLSPGKYVFHIQASTDLSFYKSNEATYQFTINRPFWRRWWFLLITVVLGIVITYLIIILRERRLKNLSLLQKERMIFEYEHLKSQVNPHFLFNSLNTLASLMEYDKEAAVDYTTQLSDLYRNMLANKDKDLIQLADELEILSHYLYIQKARFGSAIKLEMNIPDVLKKGKYIIPMALQIVVENAIKHNVVSISKPLTIYVTANNDMIEIRNPIQPKISKEKSAGLGLENIQKRYTLLTHKHVSFGVNENDFIVTLPLI